MVRTLCAIPLALALCLVVGCGEASLPVPDVAKVSGTVNLDGKPMQGGVVRFNVAGQPPKEAPITNGSFSGEAYIGLNTVDVVWDQDGEPNSMNPGTFMQVNKVDSKFMGPNSPLQEAIGAEGKSDLKFDVTSAKPAKK